MPGFSVHHQFPELAQTHVHWVGDANHLILWCPLLLLPSIFPSIRVFSNELVLCIRWPKYWSFNFSISPSSEYLGLISFRMNWLDLLAVQGTLKSFLHHHSSKASFFGFFFFFNGRLESKVKLKGKIVYDRASCLLAYMWYHASLSQHTQTHPWQCAQVFWQQGFVKFHLSFCSE